MTSWKDQLNKRLRSSTRLRGYACVQVLIIYWKDGDAGFCTEGQLMGELFKDELKYSVDEFAIPSSDSYLELLDYITRSVLSLVKKAREKNGSSLLIIHYGGHGDRNDDRQKREEKLAVWAACVLLSTLQGRGLMSNRHDQGDPTIEWSQIQDNLKKFDTDILLLLDCCYAAQAGRSREQEPARIELLAAAAMGMQTPLPGDRSFTRAIIREIRSILKKEGRIKVVDLHQRLVAREANLWATPVYVKLTTGTSSIELEVVTETEHNDEENQDGPVLQLLIRTKETLHEANTDEIFQWLTYAVPSVITSLRVDDILNTTAQLHTVVKKVVQKEGTFAKVLDQPALEDILYAWNDLIALVELYNIAQRNTLGSDALNQKMSIIQQRAREFLISLNNKNETLRDTARINILNAPLQEMLDDDTREVLGIADQVRLRRIVGLNTPDHKEYDLKTSHVIQSCLLLEFKHYDIYTDPQILPSLTKRIERLANLLEVSKNTSFCSLKCRSWHHEKLDYRYALEFEIPTIFDATGGAYHTLQSLIEDTVGAGRPTLDNRFHMATLLAKAVQEWHSVGWVHQGICSPNIIFFLLRSSGRIDYRSPFLHGFQFSRPKLDPSVGLSSKDIALDVYRHPDRQGDLRKGHLKTHDFYSLGVVLLEIGLWQSAFKIVVGITKSPLISPIEMQKKLLKATKERLCHYAGCSYQAAVEACLLGSFKVDLDDANDSQLAISFKKEVIDRLAKGVGRE